jgi:hypothetical protein
VTRPRTTAGKRNVQQHKLEKARAKQEKMAARRAAPPEESSVKVGMSESELIDQLAKLHAEIEAGRISLQEFEDSRDDLRRQLQQLDEGNSNA